MTEANYTPRLKTRYQDEIRGKLSEQFGYDNVMQIPGLTKIVVNMGVGDAARDSKMINGALEDLTASIDTLERKHLLVLLECSIF